MKKSPVQILYYPVKNSYNLKLSTKLLSLFLQDSIFGGNAKLKLRFDCVSQIQNNMKTGSRV